MTAVCFFLTAVVPLSALAEDDTKVEEAKQFFEAGKRFYEMQNWRAAVDQFKQAMKLLPSPILDYNIAICYEKLGRPKPAVKYYKRYLVGQPQADNRADVEAKIAELEAQIAAAPPPAPPPQQPPPAEGAPPPAPPPNTEASDEAVPPAPPPPPPGGYYQYGAMPALPPPAPVERSTPFYKLWWFWALVGLGVVVIIAAAASSVQGDTTTYAGNARPLAEPPQRGLLNRSLQLAPPQPAGVLFRF